MDKLLIGLSLIFVVAKLFGVISWSWWLVLLPSIIYVLIALTLVALTILLVIIK